MPTSNEYTDGGIGNGLEAVVDVQHPSEKVLEDVLPAEAVYFLLWAFDKTGVDLHHGPHVLIHYLLDEHEPRVDRFELEI